MSHDGRSRGSQPNLSGTSPADWWWQAQEEQLQLCAELESIADSLPARVDAERCMRAAATLAPLIRGVHDYENTVLFPQIEAQAAQTPDLSKTIARLKTEHFEDECFAEELAERLMQLGSGGRGINMEATGYMLRGFFEAMRRHIAFERDYFSALWVASAEMPAENPSDGPSDSH